MLSLSSIINVREFLWHMQLSATGLPTCLGASDAKHRAYQTFLSAEPRHTDGGGVTRRSISGIYV